MGASRYVGGENAPLNREKRSNVKTHSASPCQRDSVTSPMIAATATSKWHVASNQRRHSTTTISYSPGILTLTRKGSTVVLMKNLPLR